MKSSKTCSAYLIHIIAEICRPAPVFNRCTGLHQSTKEVFAIDLLDRQAIPRPSVCRHAMVVGWIRSPQLCRYKAWLTAIARHLRSLQLCPPGEPVASSHAKKDHHISTASGREPQLDCCFETALVPVILSSKVWWYRFGKFMTMVCSTWGIHSLELSMRRQNLSVGPTELAIFSLRTKHTIEVYCWVGYTM